MSNYYKDVIIFENNEYSLYGIIKSEENPVKTLLRIQINGKIIDIGELINDDINREWVAANDYAIAILRNKNNENDNEIICIYYIPNSTFIFGDKRQLDTMYKALFNTALFNKNIDKNETQKTKVYDFRNRF